MRLPRMIWTRSLLLLPSIVLAGEPAATQAPSATADIAGTRPLATEAAAPESRSLAQAFDLRGGAVRSVVRDTAATQSSRELRVEPVARQKPDLTAALIVDHPIPRRESAPRLPARPASCDGFWSCGLETLLGLHDHDFEDEQEYARQERHRLMNQGSFTDKSGCEACNSPADPNGKLRDPEGQGEPIRP